MTDLYKAVLLKAPDYSVDSKELLMIVVYHCRKSKVKPESFYFSLKEAPEGSEAYNLYLTMQECPETLGDLLEKAQNTMDYLKGVSNKTLDFTPNKSLDFMPRSKAMSLRRNELLITTVGLVIGGGIIITMITNNVIENTFEWLIKLPYETIEYRRR